MNQAAADAYIKLIELLDLNPDGKKRIKLQTTTSTTTRTHTSCSVSHISIIINDKDNAVKYFSLYYELGPNNAAIANVPWQGCCYTGIKSNTIHRLQRSAAVPLRTAALLGREAMAILSSSLPWIASRPWCVIPQPVQAEYDCSDRGDIMLNMQNGRWDMVAGDA